VTGGLALAIAVASVGHISGAHLNPAVTLGLAVNGRFPWAYAPGYVIAQFAGATAEPQPPRVTQKLVPVFTGQELTRLELACAGRSFAQRRDTAIIAVLEATGIRLAELAGRLRAGQHSLEGEIDDLIETSAMPQA
jgi:hypothetical protein